MIITKSTRSDIDTIMAWRRERTAWLRELGSDQWPYPLPRKAIAATVMAGQTWIVRDGESPVGTITLATASDVDDLWKPDEDPEPLWYPADDATDALYAAKAMVPRDRAGLGLGSEMLDWAAGRAFDAGLTWLRFDAWTTNERLHAYYQRLGFTLVRIVESRVSGACFQKPAQPYRGWLKTEE